GAGEVLDLMTATGAGGDDNGAEGLGADLLGERFADFAGEFVFGSERAKGASHSAAAGVEERNGAGGQASGELLHESGIHQGFGVTMGMDDDVGRFVIELKRGGFVVEKLFD